MACLHTDHRTVNNPQWAEEKESKKGMRGETAQDWLLAGQKHEYFKLKTLVGQFSRAQVGQFKLAPRPLSFSHIHLYQLRAEVPRKEHRLAGQSPKKFSPQPYVTLFRDEPAL